MLLCGGLTCADDGWGHLGMNLLAADFSRRHNRTPQPAPSSPRFPEFCWSQQPCLHIYDGIGFPLAALTAPHTTEGNPATVRFIHEEEAEHRRSLIAALRLAIIAKDQPQLGNPVRWCPSALGTVNRPNSASVPNWNCGSAAHRGQGFLRRIVGYVHVHRVYLA